MFLYIDTLKTNSNELLKAVKINLLPKVPGVPAVPSAPKAPAAPKAPTTGVGGGETGGVGEATGASAGGGAGGVSLKGVGSGRPKSVDCPLGADCPDGGKHRPDSKVFQKHTAEAQKRGLAATAKPSEGPEKDAAEEASKIESPEAQNLGSLGSDEAPKPEPTEEKPTAEVSEEAKPEAAAESKPKGKSKSKFVTDKYDEAHSAAIRASAAVHTGESSHEEAAAAHLAAAAQATPGSKVHQRHLKYAEMHNNSQNPYQKQLEAAELGQARTEISPLGQARTEISPAAVEGPLRDESYKPKQLVRKDAQQDAKTEVSPPPEAVTDYVEDSDLGADKTEISAPPEEEEDISDADVEGPIESTQEKLSSVAQKQRDKAKNLLKETKAKHEETSKKAKEIKQRNQEKITKYESATKQYEEDKAAGKKKLKKPKKPGLEKETAVPDKPELREPESESEKLRHQDHTSRANKLASDAESHLLYNEDLSDSDRKKLEHAHAIGSFHAGIEHHPNAAMKAEVAEAEKIVRRFGKPRTSSDVKTQISPPPEVEETELGDDDIEDITGKTEISPPPEGAEEDEAADSKAKTQISPPPEAMEGAKPTSDIEHLRVQSHKDKAGSLRDKINSHLKSNPNLSAADRERAQRVLNALDKHHGLETTPTKEQTQELNELAKHAGDLGKKEFEAEPPADEADEEEAPKRKDFSAFNYLIGKMKEGAARGQAIGRAAISPGGAASTATQTLNYGLSGAVGTGHKLLTDTDRSVYKQKIEDFKQKKAAEKEAENAENESTKAAGSEADLSAADLSAERAASEAKLDAKKSLTAANTVHFETIQKAKELLVRYKHTGSYPY